MDRERDYKRATMADVAAKAGVSVATVSYVINGMRERGAPTRIRPETAERVRAAMQDVDYTLNVPARNLRRRRSDRVIFLAARLSSPYSHALALDIQDRLRPQGLFVDVHVGSEAEDLRLGMSMLDQHIADGLIVQAGDAAVPILRPAAAAGHAVVVVGPTKGDDVLDVVIYDETDAVREGVTHLVQRRPRTYVVFSQTADASADQRAATALETLKAEGINDDAIHVRTLPHDRELAFQTAMETLSLLPKPIALYAGSDVSAIGVLWACHHLELRIPDDITVLGHGDIGESHIAFPPLTTLGPTMRDPAAATDLILSRLKNRHTPGRSVIIPWRLVPRRST